MSAWPWWLLIAGAAVLPDDPALRLPACPDSPNCVSTQAPRDDARHYLAPLRWPGGIALGDVLDAVAAVLRQEPRTRVEERSDVGIVATARSRVFGFVDDVVIVADEATRTLHLRSASRVGYGDLGVNRRRGERLLDALAERLGAERVP